MNQSSFLEILVDQIIEKHQNFFSSSSAESPDFKGVERLQGDLEFAHIGTLIHELNLKTDFSKPLKKNPYSLQKATLTSLAPLILPRAPYSWTTHVRESFDFFSEALESLHFEGSLEIKSSILSLKWTPTALSQTQVKSAFRLMAFKAHPDHGGSPEFFLNLKKHYQILEQFAKTPNL